MIYIILVLALILRLVNLNQSLWLDEAVQAITAQNSLSYIIQEIRGDFHPPLYHFLMHFWVRVFGNSEIALRMPSVLFGVGTVYLVWKLGRLSHLGYLSDLGALFLATAPFHIYYSQEARMYSMACFLTSMSFYYFLRLLEDDKGNKGNWGKRGFYFLFTLLAVYTDYYAFFALLAQNIYLLVKKKYKFLILNSLFIILCYIPWFPMLITQVKTGMLATQSLPEWGKLVNLSFLKALPLTLIKFSIGRITIFNKKIYALVILGVLGALGALWVRVIREIRKEKGDWGKIILTWLAVPMIISWLVSIFVPNYQPFRLLLVLPAFYLLLAKGITQLRTSILHRLGVGFVIAVNLVSLGVYFFNPYFHREDWRSLVTFLKSEPQTMVVLPSASSNWPIRYYDPESEINMVYGSTGVETVEDLSSFRNKGNKVFYIRYLVPLFDPNELILAELGINGYTKVEEISFNQIPVWEYQRN